LFYIDAMAAAALRVFFAVWPDSSLVTSLAALAAEVARETQGRPTAPENIHLTLAFLGEQPVSRMAPLCALAARVGGQHFALTLDEIGCFRKAGIAWLGASAPQLQLIALQERLAGELRARGFPIDERPYAPHLTLARRIEVAIRRSLAAPIFWKVNSFALIASETTASGPSYRSLADWPLAPE
jgi:2'-5' RNA ligase